MFITVQAATTGAEIDLNIREISCIINKEDYYNVHVSSGFVFSIDHKTYWDILVPRMFPEE